MWGLDEEGRRARVMTEMGAATVLPDGQICTVVSEPNRTEIIVAQSVSRQPPIPHTTDLVPQGYPIAAAQQKAGAEAAKTGVSAGVGCKERILVLSKAHKVFAVAGLGQHGIVGRQPQQLTGLHPCLVLKVAVIKLEPLFDPRAPARHSDARLACVERGKNVGGLKGEK